MILLWCPKKQHDILIFGRVLVMKKIMKARKSGFTLVELLIVIMIIAILAGMMMLATGSATDSANATKIINDLRATKSAALLIYMDNNQSWKWAEDAASASDNDDLQKSFDLYMDKPLFGDNRYKLVFAKDVDLGASGGTTGVTNKRTLIGFTISDLATQSNLRNKLAGNASKAGLYDGDGAIYTGDASKTSVYMVLN